MIQEQLALPDYSEREDDITPWSLDEDEFDWGLYFGRQEGMKEQKAPNPSEKDEKEREEVVEKVERTLFCRKHYTPDYNSLKNKKNIPVLITDSMYRPKFSSHKNNLSDHIFNGSHKYMGRAVTNKEKYRDKVWELRFDEYNNLIPVMRDRPNTTISSGVYARQLMGCLIAVDYATLCNLDFIFENGNVLNRTKVYVRQVDSEIEAKRVRSLKSLPRFEARVWTWLCDEPTEYSLRPIPYRVITGTLNEEHKYWEDESVRKSGAYRL